MYYKRFIKNSLVQLLSSLVPIMFCMIVGWVISPELSSIFTLTYPIQFVFMLITDVLVYSGFTYAKKDKKENMSDYMLSIIVLSAIISFTLIGLSFVFFRYYCLFMNFDLNMFYNWGLLYTIYIFSDIGVNAVRLYFIFTEDDKRAISSYLFKVLIVVVPVTISVIITKDSSIAIIVYLILNVLWYVIYFYKIFKRFKFRFKFSFSCLKYGIPDSVDNIGMLLFFAFGIGNIAENSLALVVAYNLDSLLTDWLWDIKIIGFEPIIRSELCLNDFDYKLCRKQYRFSYIIINIIHLVLVVGSLFVFDVNKILFIKMSIISSIYLLVYSFYVVERELLITHGYELAYGVLTFIEYVVRIIISLSSFIWLFISSGVIFCIIFRLFTLFAWRKSKDKILKLYCN